MELNLKTIKEFFKLIDFEVKITNRKTEFYKNNSDLIVPIRSDEGVIFISKERAEGDKRWAEKVLGDKESRLYKSYTEAGIKSYNNFLKRYNKFKNYPFEHNSKIYYPLGLVKGLYKTYKGYSTLFGIIKISEYFFNE